MLRDPKTELRPHLDSGETLLWTGKPKTGIVFRQADIFLVPFTLLWAGFAFSWFLTALSSELPFFFALFGIPFVLVGLYVVFGRFIHDALQRKNTTYGLTENRIIIKSGITSKKIKSLNIRTLSDIEYTEKNDGTGTITIGPKHPMMNWGSVSSSWPGMKTTPQLEMIPNVRKVYNKIIELQQGK